MESSRFRMRLENVCRNEVGGVEWGWDGVGGVECGWDGVGGVEWGWDGVGGVE